MQEGRWELRLPALLSSWEGILRNELLAIENLYLEDAGRWPTSASPSTLSIWIASSPKEAKEFLLQEGLEGDATVARTYPSRALALIPLPRADSLLSTFESPPQTWLQTFRHESAHLLSLNRPNLRASPLWFQEGYAESWVELGASTWPSGNFASIGTAWGGFLNSAIEKGDKGGGALDFLETMPSEVRLGGWRALARLCMEETMGDRPWELGSVWTVGALLDAMPAGFSDRLPIGRGREIGISDNGRHFLLASYPGQMVATNAGAWLGDGALLATLRVGRTGIGEAGLLINGSGGRRLRIRCNVFGAIVAYTEEDNLEVGALQGHSPSGVRLGEARTIRITRHHGNLRIVSDDYRRSFPSESAPLPPFSIELYVGDGALSAKLIGVSVKD